MVKALMVVDMFVKDIVGRSDEQKLVTNIYNLIVEFKKQGLPVIFTGAILETGSNELYNELWRDEYGSDHKTREKNLAIVPSLLNLGYDQLVLKSMYSAFYGTNLKAYCKNNYIDEIYLVGVSGGCCVHYTGLDAMYRGIRPIMVEDATSSPTPDVHVENIQRFNFFVGKSMVSEEVIKVIK